MKEITVLFTVITVYIFICDRKPSTSIAAKIGTAVCDAQRVKEA